MDSLNSMNAMDSMGAMDSMDAMDSKVPTNSMDSLDINGFHGHPCICPWNLWFPWDLHNSIARPLPPYRIMMMGLSHLQQGPEIR